MNWRSVFGRDEPDHGSDADEAVQAGRDELARVKGRRQKVRRVADDLEELRRLNGFAEGFYRIFRDEGGPR